MHTTQCGTESITNLGEKIWELVPQNMKEASSLSSFKNRVKKWIPQKCLCRLCKTYIAEVPFI